MNQVVSPAVAVRRYLEGSSGEGEGKKAKAIKRALSGKDFDRQIVPVLASEKTASILQPGIVVKKTFSNSLRVAGIGSAVAVPSLSPEALFDQLSGDNFPQEQDRRSADREILREIFRKIIGDLD